MSSSVSLVDLSAAVQDRKGQFNPTLSGPEGVVVPLGDLCRQLSRRNPLPGVASVSVKGPTGTATTVDLVPLIRYPLPAVETPAGGAPTPLQSIAVDGVTLDLTVPLALVAMAGDISVDVTLVVGAASQTITLSQKDAYVRIPNLGASCPAS